MKLIIASLLLIGVLAQTYPKQSPIIGIYTQTNDEDGIDHFQSYISASYIKFIEMSGAQVVPIYAFSTQNQIVAVLSKINGILFPGGDEPIDFSQRWTQNMKFILEWAMKQNDAGNIFPIWSVCLGYESLAVITSGSTNNMTALSPVRGEINVINTMRFVNQSEKGYILGDMPERLISKLTTGQGVMFYDHNWIVSMDTYSNNKNLSNFWKVITESTSPYNERFVALWQARKYPFYGVQFHPEKNSFQWKIYADRSSQAVQIQQIMSNKFIEKARQSKNSFSSYDQYQKSSIYNFQPTVTSMPFTRIYRFPQKAPSQNISQGKLTNLSKS